LSDQIQEIEGELDDNIVEVYVDFVDESIFLEGFVQLNHGVED
jgi:hypothetical protein